MATVFWSIPVSLVLAHGISEADKKAMLDGGNLRYLWLGATHMLTGYDHLLFIFGVIFFLTGFRDIVKFITAFTVGHSITLLFATLLGITANYYLVDAVIALSVVYKGFENLDGFRKYLKMESPNLVWVIFGFGLIHGFGLSTRLQQLPLGKSGGMVMRILSFNVGVELGQICALAIMLLIILSWRRSNSFERFSTASNFFLILAGGFLFLMQMHGYAHMMYPDDFGFNKDEHYHEHIRMKQRKQKKIHGHSHSGEHGHSHSGEHGHSHSGEHGHSHSGIQVNDKGSSAKAGTTKKPTERRVGTSTKQAGKANVKGRDKPSKRRSHGHDHSH